MMFESYIHGPAIPPPTMRTFKGAMGCECRETKEGIEYYVRRSEEKDRMKY